MVLASEVDRYGKLGWIAATILGFIVFWPIGLAILGFLAFSGRMRFACGGDGPWSHGAGRWYNTAQSDGRGCGWGARRREPPSSGNAAFDEYRAETLRRLEEEQKEFVDYLERLRQAKDKAEFDAFMAERRRRSEPPEAPNA
jgi:hypothetical protein